ncbi:hypothetical protein [Mesobacillus maritimus]|uniref:Uncharacterized protein n=1 Tax=Mesobacillus maritimus TaxID=1643336 RepID=A0ABS7K3M3_9BACI|nr:hypothetical protein [Mesobacillus maritimus]MBY0096794.1 hypothetical protein [Mesobacillus maritimus]
MGLFFNQRQKKEIFQNTNDKIKDRNQNVYRENFLQSMINEQQQLNKQFAENATKHAEKHEKYSQALLDQLTTQDSLLLEMHRKLQANEKTTNSIHEHMQIQDEIKELLERHDDIQNIYHKTVMERFDNQDSKITQKLNQHDAKVMNWFQKQETQMNQLNKTGSQVTEHMEQHHTQLSTDLYKIHTQLMNEFNRQELQTSEQLELVVAKVNEYFNQNEKHLDTHTNTLDAMLEQFSQYEFNQATGFQQINNNLTENFRNQDAKIKEHIGEKDAQLKEYVSGLDASLTKHFDEQNQHLKHLVDHQDVQTEQLERKLDFIKSTIFERAADLSEKLDGHFKKFTEFFGGLFSRYEKNSTITLPEGRENQEKMKTQ